MSLHRRTGLSLLVGLLGTRVEALTSDAEIIVGNVRVQALSDTLVRIEPKGPKGFENRTTFMVVDRDSWGGIKITKEASVKVGDATIITTLTTASYKVILTQGPPPPPPPPPTPFSMCGSQQLDTDIRDGERIKSCQDYSKPCLTKTTQATCCNACSATPNAECTAWIWQPSNGDCWLMAFVSGSVSAGDRVLGGKINEGGDTKKPIGVSATVTAPDGTVLFAADDLNHVSGNLFWPSPMTEAGETTPSYGIKDYPRFFTPPWAVAPIPVNATVDPALVATNGYDFTNNQAGDLYVFLLGKSLASYHASRREFITLTGPCPVLPDYAFGTWFTYWHSYSEKEAKDDISRWESGNLPIDVWALDMNWRNTSSDHLNPGQSPYHPHPEIGSQDHYYDHPNSNLFPGDGPFGDSFTEWFAFLKGKKLRTYFNDHPFPVAMRNEGGLQTSPEEVAFRWQGLSSWMERGLTYWWFDHNWGFSIPPPFINISVTSGNWEGLDNAAWGSHVYYSSVEYYDKTVRDKAGDQWYGGKPMALTKFGLPDWRANTNPTDAAESPAQHRYPVWWTGDGVPLQGAVQSTVDSGVHGFKTYVHSDCGGDYRPHTGGDLLRWTAHCAFSTIHRFHGDDHRPWGYDTHTEDVIRSYLTARYKLVPSLIAAGEHAATTGYPFVTRCDMIWSEHNESASNNQYIFLNDTLVAPIWDSATNATAQSVWIPPGTWMDAWEGSTTIGPQRITVTKPYEQQPMWHSHNGGLTIITDSPGLRVDHQDWSESLTLELRPDTSSDRRTTERTLHAKPAGGSLVAKKETTAIVMTTDTVVQPGRTAVRLAIGGASDGAQRSWVVRVHLLPGQRAVDATVDGVAVGASALKAMHIAPLPAGSVTAFPFGGRGAVPPPAAGPVLELSLSAAAHPRDLALFVLN